MICSRFGQEHIFYIGLHSKNLFNYAFTQWP